MTQIFSYNLQFHTILFEIVKEDSIFETFIRQFLSALCADGFLIQPDSAPLVSGHRSITKAVQRCDLVGIVARHVYVPRYN